MDGRLFLIYLEGELFQLYKVFPTRTFAQNRAGSVAARRQRARAVQGHQRGQLACTSALHDTALLDHRLADVRTGQRRRFQAHPCAGDVRPRAQRQRRLHFESDWWPLGTSPRG